MKILVIGDSCIDAYVYGKCDRLCPAAPVPVFVPVYQKENQGMAGNVYQNALSFGLSCDILTNESRNVVKTRFVEDKTNHIIMRLDKGDCDIQRIKNLTSTTLQSYDAIIISDYDKGYLTECDIELIARNHNLVFLDTKKLLGNYARHCAYIKINEYEYEKTKHLFSELADWIEDKLIVTLGSDGCTYKGKNFPVQKVEVKDLTGAGDTFLAALVCNFLETRNIEKSIEFANKCATQVVQQRGVAIVR